MSPSLLAGASGTVVAQDPGNESGDPGSVLFVGNSFTYFNGGVEKQVAALAAAEEFSREIDVDASTEPGATLKGHWLGSEPDYLDGAVDEIREGDHEVVVLQGDIPMLFERDVAPFLEYARLFDREIKDAGAATVFFMTWPYERVDWHERSDWIDLDGIVEAHRQVEAELDAKVAPVGVAMEKALAERPDLAMLGADREHESPAGTYLAAATIYATLLDQSPEGLDFAPSDVSTGDAAFLQRVAWETVQEWQEQTPAAE